MQLRIFRLTRSYLWFFPDLPKDDLFGAIYQLVGNVLEVDGHVNFGMVFLGNCSISGDDLLLTLLNDHQLVLFVDSISVPVGSCGNSWHSQGFCFVKALLDQFQCFTILLCQSSLGVSLDVLVTI